MSETNDEGDQMLVLVLDANPNQLLFARQQGAFTQWMNAVLSFVNSHLMLHSSNRVCLVAAHATGCSYLYPDAEAPSGTLSRQQDGQYEAFYQVETAVRQKLQRVLLRDTENGRASGSESLLSGAMSMALSHINKAVMKLGPGQKLHPRLLVMTASGDSAAQYMNYMNIFFTAQKMAIPIDTCMIMQDSGLLQQGSDITGGTYLKVEQLEGLLQYLIWIFLPGPKLRKTLGAPPRVRVDYRAACFCHRNLVDVAFVCSVCLSIFCRFNPVCTTCHSVFKAPGLLPPSKKKKLEGTSQIKK